MDQIVVNHKELQILFGFSSRFKYLNLRINSYGQIEILANLFMKCSRENVFDFIKNNASFIEEQLDLLSKTDLPTFKNGTSLQLLGKKYSVYRSKRYKKIIKVGNDIVIPSKFSLYDIKTELETVLLDVIKEYIDYYATHYNFEVPRYCLTSSDRFWGSCIYKEAGNEWLEFNIALVFLPTEFIDYIVLHELCHLKHRKHGKLFWNEVEKIMPDAKKRDKALNSFCLNWYLERLGIKRLRCY